MLLGFLLYGSSPPPSVVTTYSSLQNRELLARSPPQLTVAIGNSGTKCIREILLIVKVLEWRVLEGEGREEEEGLTDVQTNRTGGRKRGRKSHGRRKAERTCIRSTPQHDLWEVSEEQTQHACRHSARIDDLDRHNQTG